MGVGSCFGWGGILGSGECAVHVGVEMGCVVGHVWTVCVVGIGGAENCLRWGSGEWVALLRWGGTEDFVVDCWVVGVVIGRGGVVGHLGW